MKNEIPTGLESAPNSPTPSSRSESTALYSDAADSSPSSDMFRRAPSPEDGGASIISEAQPNTLDHDTASNFVSAGSAGVDWGTLGHPSVDPSDLASRPNGST